MNSYRMGFLEELEKNMPKSDTGNKTVRLHQLLTVDIGNPHLIAQINQIVTLFQLSDNMKHRWRQFEKINIRQSEQMELPFKFDDNSHSSELAYQEKKLSNFNVKLKKR